MKVRESGMPAETMWDGFFSPTEILRKLGLGEFNKAVLDAGSGYGSFSVPASQIIQGRVFGLDIEKDMIRVLTEKIRQQKIKNIELIQTDFASTGFCFRNETVDYVMLFNILHAENPLFLTKEAYRILSPNGKVGVIHWNYDEKTPRGPPMVIRPKPEQCRNWVAQAGFSVSEIIDLPPFHYGFIGRKTPGKRNRDEGKQPIIRCEQRLTIAGTTTPKTSNELAIRLGVGLTHTKLTCQGSETVTLCY